MLRLPRNSGRWIKRNALFAVVITAGLTLSCGNSEDAPTATEATSASAVADPGVSAGCADGYRTIYWRDFSGGVDDKSDKYARAVARFMYNLGYGGPEPAYCNSLTDEMLFEAGRRVLTDNPGLCEGVESGAGWEIYGEWDLSDNWSDDLVDSAATQWDELTLGGSYHEPTDLGYEYGDLRRYSAENALMSTALIFCDR